MPRSNITAKQHMAEGRIILALCDTNLLGKSVHEEDKILDLSKPFFQGTEVEEKKALKLISGAGIINAVGKDSVNLLKKAGYDIKPERVKEIPHIQLVII